MPYLPLHWSLDSTPYRLNVVADILSHKKSGSQTHTYFSSNQKARDSLFAGLFCMCCGLFSEPVSVAISRRDVATYTILVLYN